MTGHDAEMASLRDLFWLHFQIAGPQIPLWDEWLPNATLWPAIGSGPKLNAMRERWAKALAGREIDPEGYVVTRQHDGPAHAEGWPFPTWMQAGGVGWHFRPIGVAGYGAPPATTQGWKLTGVTDKGLGEKGWQFDLKSGPATLETPAFAIDAHRFPWLRLNWWATGLEHTKCYIEWTTKEEPEFGSDRRIYFSAPADASFEQPRELRTMIATSHEPNWKGTITQLRIGFENADHGQIVIKSFHVACDTRQNVNNLNFIRGCHDYFLWTDDVDFLRGQMPRIRTAMQFVDREFQTHAKKCIYTTWPGHEGRSGVRDCERAEASACGRGNWEQLLGHSAVRRRGCAGDHVLLRYAEEISGPGVARCRASGMESSERRRVRLGGVAEVRRRSASSLSAAILESGRPDDSGRSTSMAIFTTMASRSLTTKRWCSASPSPEQAKSICDWVGGRRTVAGDTSVGDDIYHWRFGPRSTTRRNLDYYFWGWSNPESIPWGDEVQDGGAVLGWTYYHLMAQLKTAGPDEAAPAIGNRQVVR